MRKALRKEITRLTKELLDKPEMDGELYAELRRVFERPVLDQVLLHTRGNQSETGRILGLSRGTIRKKLKDHGIV